MRHLGAGRAHSAADLADHLLAQVAADRSAQAVHRGLEAIFRRFRRQVETATDKKIDNDVALIKKFLYEHIGTTFAEATTDSDDNLLDLDLTDWGGSRSGRERRQGAPWAQMAREMQDVHEHVSEEIKDMCRWHMWAP